jgi:hypothetical protein
MMCKQIFCSFVFEGFLIYICPFVKQKFDNFKVELFLAVIHLDFDRAEEVQ